MSDLKLLLFTVSTVTPTTIVKSIEPAHDKTYSNSCATSEDSDQPVHPRSLIRVFAERMCLIQPQVYPQRYNREPSAYWMDEQADLSLCWLHRSYCRF